LIRDIFFELDHSFLEVFIFLDISQRDTEGIDEHGNDTEVKTEGFSYRVCEPTDKVTEEPDPCDGNSQSKWIVRLFAFAWVRDRCPLRVSKWQEEQIL